MVTNHYLAGDAGLALDEVPDSQRQSHIRYETLSALCLDAGGVMTADEVRSALASAAQSNFSDTNGGELTSRPSPPPSMTQRIGSIPIV